MLKADNHRPLRNFLTKEVGILGHELHNIVLGDDAASMLPVKHGEVVVLCQRLAHALDGAYTTSVNLILSGRFFDKKTGALRKLKTQ